MWGFGLGLSGSGVWGLVARAILIEAAEVAVTPESKHGS